MQPCIAVAGANGFIGRAIVLHLRQRGHRVLAITRRPAYCQGSDEVSLSDYKDTETLANALAPASCLIIAAARAHQTAPQARLDDASFAVNAELTSALLRGARLASVKRTVLISSIGVNGRQTGDHAFTEEDPPAPVDAYARSKWQCERLARQACSDGKHELVIVRPPLVYGLGAPGNFGRLLRLISKGYPLPFGGIHNRRSLLALGNLVDALRLCAVHPEAANQTYLVSDGEDLSTPDLIRRLAHATGRPARIWRVPPGALKGAAAMIGRSSSVSSLCESLQVDSSKIRLQLGWRPPLTVDEGLALLRAASSSMH